MGIATIDPTSNETLKTYPPFSDEEVDARIERVANAFTAYRKTSFADRARWLVAAAELLEAEKEYHAKIMTEEMGKPIKAALSEVEKCALGCRYYAEHGAEFLADEEVRTNAQRSFIRYAPLGPVLAIMPWNFPYWQVFRFAAPALMAGNVGLLKHASNVPHCALEIERIIERAGFPADVFLTLLVESDKVKRILEDPRIRAATLTGSEGAGRAVASKAGQQIKKTVLELGGSDPFIVMPSADLKSAVTTAVTARAINNGQSCIAAKRFIVADTIADEFEARFVEGMRALKIGDPLDPQFDLGPLATPDILKTLDRQVRESVELGARLLTGGKRIDRPGNFYEPTVLADVPPDAPAATEELFGPVAAIFRARDIDEAIALANSTKFGLGSSAWTNDERERARFIDEIEAGQVFINGMVASDPRLPFGGVKHSGYGRELHQHGIREFVNIKTVWIGGGGGPGAGTE
jgi:succinate-semialdehyde dehydrogenase/glutarate-semialdehyde dehydrogenase